MMSRQSLLLLAALAMAGCGGAPGDSGAAADKATTGTTGISGASSFNDAVGFLQEHGTVEVLEAPTGARVALSPDYQGRVMTSAVAPDAPAYGFVNRDFISAGETGTAFDNFGGEDRFWLGPEGGQFSLYFPPNSEFTLEKWQVPAAFQEGAWSVTARSDTSVTFAHTMHLANRSGTTFDLGVERTARLLSPGDLDRDLGLRLPDGVRWVGFETVNRVTNSGDRAWEKETGLPSIWILGQSNTFGTSYVVIPLEDASGAPGVDVVHDAYFGKVPDDRLDVHDDYLLFKADGEYRSKIGIGPEHARDVFGSYSDSVSTLTLVQYSKPAGATDYVNSLWEMQEHPYAGDVVNSYNDGTLAWYEMESSSPALALAPGESYTHTHRIVHLTGDRAALDSIAREVLGVPLAAIAAGTAKSQSQNRGESE